MSTIQFVTHRDTNTQYQIVEAWDIAFKQWCESHNPAPSWDHIAVISDEKVWALYESHIRTALSPLNRPITTLLFPSGENSKNLGSLSDLVDTLIQNRIHRRDLLICVGGGVCCDLGGLLALLYMRGMDYVNLPTSLMAQIDGAIGGKVGINWDARKNLLGGFHHPLLVLIDPMFLDTLPPTHFRSALAEAVKIAIIREDEHLLGLLERRSGALFNRERGPMIELIERCLKGKLDLLADDPYEYNLDRALNLGHAVAHALERLPIMPGGRQPTHGEAVSLGLVATTRYAFRYGLCSEERMRRLLGILLGLGLPLVPEPINTDHIRGQLNRIADHRGGRFRLVIPTDKGGVNIIPHANLDLLMECLFPIEGMPL